jgi:glycosyltransferase involved in cell wall biosynthesis
LPPIEVIFVDDASDDDTLETLYAISRSIDARIPTIIVPLTTNLGAASARNIGWERASGRYVAFLDSDDSWHPEKLEIQYQIMIQSSAILVCGTKHAIIRSNEFPSLEGKSRKVCRVNFRQLIWKNHFTTSSVVVRNDLAERFCIGKRHMEDHLLWLEIAATGGELVCIDINLTAHYKYDYGEAGLSKELSRMELAEIHNYRLLYQKGLIGQSLLLFLIVWSLLKYGKRLLIVTARRL